MSEEQLIQSFVPTALAEEITKRYSRGTASLVYFINHYSQRVQMQDALASAIEKTASGGTSKFASIKGGGAELGVTSALRKQQSSEEFSDQTQALQKEVEAQVRMHLHLGERINNEIVRSLDNFMNKSAWLVAKDIEAKIRQMATAMRSHHESIPKLSARTVSKSAKASQQAKQKLEEESRALVQLQLRWHKDIAAMVDNFESADVARVELIKESIFHFEHYRSEFHKAALNGVDVSRQAAKAIRSYTRIVDVMRGDMQSPDAGAAPSDDVARNASAQASAKTSAVSSGNRPADRGESLESVAEGDGEKKGFFKRGIFRSKTKRTSKANSPNHSASSSMHSRSISSNMASSGLASGAPPSIQTALTKDTRESEAFSPGFSSDSASQSIPTALRQRGSSFMSSHSSRAPEGAQESSQQGQQKQQPSAHGSQPNDASQSSGAADFAEWVFAEGSQEIVPVSMDASVGSLVHVAAAASHLPPISEVADKQDDEQDIQGGKAQAPVASVSSSSGRIFGDIEDVNFEDVFGKSDTGAAELAAGKPQDEGKAVAAEDAKPSIDLDSVFSIPTRKETPTAGAADSSKPSASALFGSPDAFAVKQLKGNPASHRRSLSLNGGLSRSASNEGKSTEGMDKASDEDDDEDNGGEEDAGEQSFRVKFSIRDKAIKDNPDESRAALSRVTTLLRAAPSTSRGRRRDVRTMYVPSSLPITSALGVGSDIRPPGPLTPQTPMPAGSVPEKLALSNGEGSLLDEAFATPTSPMSQQSHAQSQTQTQGQNEKNKDGLEHADSSKDDNGDDDDVALAKIASASQSLNPSISEIGSEQKVVDVPVATITSSDVQAAVDEPSSIDAAAVGNSVSESVTAEPVEEHRAVGDARELAQPSTDANIADAAEAPVSDVIAAVEETVSGSAEGISENAPTSEPAGAAESAAGDASAQQKGDSSVRRRARPPPPPPGPPGARARSLRQQSQASLVTADAAVPEQPQLAKPVSEAPQTVPQAAEQDPEVRAVPRGRRLASSSGPLPISMHVFETLDFSFVHPYDGDATISHIVTGEIRMHIGGAINPLELAPLRISVQRPTQGQVQLVANPGVVIPDASLTSSLADGREWFRFVRPNLFSQVGASGIDVAVFKYQAQGSDDMRIMPMEVHQGNTCSAGNCGLMLFCEPNARGCFAGDTIVAPAVLLSIEGRITSQSSRPAAIWYRERNSLLWRLDDMEVPLPHGTDEDIDNAVQAVSKTLALKAKGEGYLLPGVIALKFESKSTRIVDVPITIGRVSANSLVPVSVIDSPSSHVVKSGKCTYQYMNPPRELIEQEEQEGQNVQQALQESQGDDNEIQSQTSGGRSRGSSMTSEASWSSAEENEEEEEGGGGGNRPAESTKRPAAEETSLAQGS